MRVGGNLLSIVTNPDGQRNKLSKQKINKKVSVYGVAGVPWDPDNHRTEDVHYHLADATGDVGHVCDDKLGNNKSR